MDSASQQYQDQHTTPVMSVSTTRPDQSILIDSQASGLNSGNGFPGVPEGLPEGEDPGGSLYAPPSFTVCVKSISEPGAFKVLNPVVVFKDQTYVLEGSQTFSMNDTVYCVVILSAGGDYRRAELARAPEEVAPESDDDVKLVVKIAEITPNQVIQYHVGAVVITGTGTSEPDDESIELREDWDAEPGENGERPKVLSVKGWHPEGSNIPSPVMSKNLLELMINGSSACAEGPRIHVPVHCESDNSVSYAQLPQTRIETYDQKESLVEVLEDHPHSSAAAGGTSDKDKLSMMVLRSKETGETADSLEVLQVPIGDLPVADGNSIEKDVATDPNDPRFRIKGWMRDDWTGPSPVDEKSLLEMIFSTGATLGYALLCGPTGSAVYATVGELTGPTKNPQPPLGIELAGGYRGDSGPAPHVLALDDQGKPVKLTVGELPTDQKTISLDYPSGGATHKAFMIKGWTGASPAYSSSIAEVLGRSSGANDLVKLLVRTADGALQYADIGKGLLQAKADDKSIEITKLTGDTIPSVMIKGWTGASPSYSSKLADVLGSSSGTNNDKVLIRKSNGSLAYADIGSGLLRAKADDKSIELKTLNGATIPSVMIKGWTDGSPVAAHSLAEVLGSDSDTSNAKLVLRGPNGVLQYMSIGTITGLTGPTGLITLGYVVTDVEWSPSACQLVITKREIKGYGLQYSGSSSVVTIDTVSIDQVRPLTTT